MNLSQYSKGRLFGFFSTSFGAISQVYLFKYVLRNGSKTYEKILQKSAVFKYWDRFMIKKKLRRLGLSLFKRFIRPVLLIFRPSLLWIFKTLCIPRLQRCYQIQLARLPKERQLFFLLRLDFGTFIALIHYARCWEELRGQTALVILTPHVHMAKELAKHVLPHTPLICPDHFLFYLGKQLFGHSEMYSLLCGMYGRLLALYPGALSLFEPSTATATRYVSSFDPRLTSASAFFSESFVEAYKTARGMQDYFEEALLDSYRLHTQCGLSRRVLLPEQTSFLKKSLGIRERYVVLHLRIRVSPRRVCYPERYNCLIDYLIEKGFSVVLQGRDEQPKFRKREGLVDYSRSSCCSIKNDLALYAGAHFGIVNKAGPELFCALCNTPQLGLNYTELCTLSPLEKLRFFPKYIREKHSGRPLSWKELLTSPAFFNIAHHVYDSNVEFYDLEEQDLIAAAEEFLPLVVQSDEKWLEYTPAQQEFKNFLHPLHLDLYDMKSAPCNVYLNSQKRSGTSSPLCKEWVSVSSTG